MRLSLGRCASRVAWRCVAARRASATARTGEPGVRSRPMPVPSPSTRPGMGAIPYRGGTTFRVWAPHAEAVFVTGTFDDWAGDATPLARDGDGDDRHLVGGRRRVSRPATSTASRSGRPDGDLSRIDPYARQVTTSVGNAVVYDPAAFDWGDDDFQQPAWDDLVIYELHVGTFAGHGRQARHLRPRGQAPAVPARARRDRAVQVMPPFEFAGDISLGLQPGPPVRDRSSGTAARTRSSGSSAPPTSTASRSSSTSSTTTSARPTSTCGGSTAGPRATVAGSTSTTTSGRGRRGATTRPDYGRGEVRTFLRDSALTWLEEFRCDGLRFDATLSHPDGRRRLGDARDALPDGWSFMAWINDEIRRAPAVEADDRRGPPATTRRSSPPTAEGGAGFGAQWDVGFVHRRPAGARRGRRRGTGHAAPSSTAIIGEGRGAPLERVIYTESHDDVANGQVRVPEAITPGRRRQLVVGASGRRSGSALVLTSPGIPMLFQGQELLEDRWFDDTVALDWAKAQHATTASSGSTTT